MPDLPIRAVAIDTGGHHTKAAYEFCRTRLNRRIWAIKGRGGPGVPVCPRRPTRTNKGKIPLFIVGVDSVKDAVYARLKLTDPGPGFVHFSRDRIPVRSMTANDLSAVVRIDGKLTGQDRSAYYQGKMDEMMGETGVRVSQVAELDGAVIGFVMARVDYGEFGRAEPTAVMDTLGVHPAYAKAGVGHALLSQLLANLATLHVDRVRTQVGWTNLDLLKFLGDCGFAPSQRLVLSKELD